MGQDTSCQRLCCTEINKPRYEISENGSARAVHWDQEQDKQYFLSPKIVQYEDQEMNLNSGQKKVKKSFNLAEQEELVDTSNIFHIDDPSTKSQNSQKIKKNIVSFLTSKDSLSDVNKSCLSIVNYLCLNQTQMKKFNLTKELTLTSSGANNQQQLTNNDQEDQWIWKEVQDIFNQLFPNNLNEVFIEYDSNWQGLYLISALNSLCLKPVYLLRMFETKSKQIDNPDITFNNQLTKSQDETKINQFYVHFLFNGIIQKVCVDNNIPFIPKKKQCLFIQSHPYGFSPLLLKAYSSLFGGYQAIQRGIFGQLIRDITWAPYEYITIQDLVSTFQYISENLKKKYLVTLCKSLDNYWVDTIVTISQELGIDKVNLIIDETLFSIFIQNYQLTLFLFYQVLLKKGQDGSLRWVHFQDINQMYTYCGVNKCNEEYYYSYITQNLNKNMHTEILVVQLENSQAANHAFITFSQQDKRLFLNQSSNSSFSYDFVRMILVKGSLNVVNRQINIESYIYDHVQVGRDSTIECNLSQGTYLLYLEIEKSTSLQSKICINSYSQHKIQFQFAESQELFNVFNPQNNGANTKSDVIKNENNNESRLIDQFLICQTKRLTENSNIIFSYQDDSEIIRINGLAAGNIFFIYQNNSKYGSVLQEKHRIRKRNDALFCREWQVEIYPQQKKIFSYPLQNGEDINDIIIDLVYTNINLIDKKVLLNIKSIENMRQVIKEQRQLNGIPINSYMYTYSYPGGYSIYFENFSKFSCTETLYYNIINLQGEDFNIQNKFIIFLLNPGQTKLFNVKRIDLLQPCDLQLKSIYQFHQ
ncbi:calpain family cysteine protease (macronuclear) [Tetrahymena thermophila SB210]|uniref:Calpain family cysteine protease n=1 Tax=Tetrahymena thermophila (strain SB210) TaxID=312017 RepID=I7M6I8_TETTS|nr:calpain family cysteine protease [Tetrahymena thermophila SB210]EAR85286.2 calpain family cysteine protease [Tetrahymena thermophila SB210]|eukprot:XP_001032949.2 calpain family cysteine protease [Tetrahymena thermophila SB210]